MVSGHGLGAAMALAVDALVGDEPLRPHPVAVFGRAMTRLERKIWADRRLPGVAYASTGLAVAAIGGLLLDLMPGGPVAGGYAAVAGRGLWSSARAVQRALEADDLPAARRLLPALVGRDPSHLDMAGIARAAVESVAENTVDGIVAPALFASVGGAAGALTYRSINTLDSMVGYRDARYERFGWASARLDDLANYVPARLTALLVSAVRPNAAREVWRCVARDAPAHPSPNAGVSEAAFAAALGLRLGGTNSYSGRVEHRAEAGGPGSRHPAVSDIEAAISLSRHVACLLAMVLAAPSLVGLVARRRTESDSASS
ncbi:MAG: adenosylcobinamide-phosphate synthase CbiB [Acidimicrobiales bacterium]